MTAPARDADPRAFVARLVQALRPLEDPGAVQAEAARLLGLHLGVNRCSYAEIDGEWAVLRGHYATGVPPLPQRIALAGFGEPLLAACRAGAFVAIDDARTDPRAAEVRGVFAALRIQAVLAVTLVKGGRWVAVLGVDSATPRTWTPAEHELLCEVAERTWAAAQQVRTEAALRSSTARQAYLLELADALRPLHDAEAIQYEAACVLGDHLAATRAYYAEIDAERGTIDIARNWTRDGAASVAGRYPFSMFAWIGPAFAAGTVIAVDDAHESPMVPEASRRALAGIDVGAFLVAPLVKAGRLVAALSVVEREPRVWTADEMQLVEDTAERTWAAVERARAEAALQRAKDELEQRVLDRTAELAATNDALEREVRERRLAEQQVKTLFRRLVSSQEAERQRVARDIHDQVGQQMTALRMYLDALLVHAGDHEALRAAVERTRRLAEELDQTIDFLTWQLRPSALDHLGLPASLGDLVHNWSDRFGIPAEFACTLPCDVRLAADVETNLYRLTQEALHNVVKHAKAEHVSVGLSSHGGFATLTIEDDGVGFDPRAIEADAAEHGLGLVSMRERATLVGGELRIDSRPGRGTAIVARVPIGRP